MPTDIEILRKMASERKGKEEARCLLFEAYFEKLVKIATEEVEHWEAHFMVGRMLTQFTFERNPAYTRPPLLPILTSELKLRIEVYKEVGPKDWFPKEERNNQIR